MTKVEAEMAASVLRVEVAQGDHVTEGDILVVLESMKMEVPVLAEDAGTVTQLHVTVGDVVSDGDVLVEIA